MRDADSRWRIPDREARPDVLYLDFLHAELVHREATVAVENSVEDNLAAVQGLHEREARGIEFAWHETTSTMVENDQYYDADDNVHTVGDKRRRGKRLSQVSNDGVRRYRNGREVRGNVASMPGDADAQVLPAADAASAPHPPNITASGALPDAHLTAFTYKNGERSFSDDQPIHNMTVQITKSNAHAPSSWLKRFIEWARKFAIKVSR